MQTGKKLKIGEIWWERDEEIAKTNESFDRMTEEEKKSIGVSEYGYGDNFQTKMWTSVRIIDFGENDSVKVSWLFKGVPDDFFDRETFFKYYEKADLETLMANKPEGIK